MIEGSIPSCSTMKTMFFKPVVVVHGSKHVSYGWSWCVGIWSNKTGMPYANTIIDSIHPTRALARARAKKLREALKQ